MKNTYRCSVCGKCDSETTLRRIGWDKDGIRMGGDRVEGIIEKNTGKATYKEIQDWVQEKYGFHVTNLNIAQVKQKHGIIERENYNKPKSPDSKQTVTSDMRIKAIEEAMRHFQMI